MLVKEVKTLRKKMDEQSAHAASLAGVNGKLEEAVVALQADIANMRKEYEAKLSAAHAAITAPPPDDATQSVDSKATDDAGALSPDPGESTDKDTAAADTSLSVAMEAIRQSAEIKRRSTGHTASGEAHTADVTAIMEEQPSTSSVSGGIHLTSGRGTDGGGFAGSVLPPLPSQVDAEGNAIDWDTTHSSDLLHLDWLSPEQRHLLEERRRDEMVLGHGDHERKKSLIDFTASLFKDRDKESSHTTPGEDEHHSDSTSKSLGEKKLSLKRFSTIFSMSEGAQLSDSEHGIPAAVASPSAGDNSAKVPPRQTHDSNSSSGTDKVYVGQLVAADGKPRCYRCGGTVEGPKYSTCKCDIPMMSPDEEDTGAMESLKGFFSKGKKSAGGFADGLVHKTKAITGSISMFSKHGEDTGSSQGDMSTTTASASSSSHVVTPSSSTVVSQQAAVAATARPVSANAGNGLDNSTTNRTGESASLAPVSGGSVAPKECLLNLDDEDVNNPTTTVGGRTAGEVDDVDSDDDIHDDVESEKL